jgi:hypothetical protein
MPTNAPERSEIAYSHPLRVKAITVIYCDMPELPNGSTVNTPMQDTAPVRGATTESSKCDNNFPRRINRTLVFLGLL